MEEQRRSRGRAAEEQRRSSRASSYVNYSPEYAVHTGPDTNEVYHVTVHYVPNVDVLCSYYSLRSLQAEMGSQVSKT